MKGLENINNEVATDLINLVNNIKGLEKSCKVEYSVQNKKGEWTKKTFNYVPLDDILNKIKEDNNFALLQPIGVDENGINGVKCILIHKTGHVFETNTYPFNATNSTKIQDEGAEITYRKRYSLGAFLGMATEEDTDGNDPEASNSEERKASPKQVEMLNNMLNEEEKNKIYEHYKNGEDIYLQCFCKPLPCHCDIIADRLQRKLIKEKLEERKKLKNNKS